MSRAVAKPSPNRTSSAGPTRAELSAWALDHDIDLVFYDPPAYFDHAILGICEGYNQEPAVLYDAALVLAAMAKDMGEDNAQEWFETNTVGGYHGPQTPRFLFRPPH